MYLSEFTSAPDCAGMCWNSPILPSFCEIQLRTASLIVPSSYANTHSYAYWSATLFVDRFNNKPWNCVYMYKYYLHHQHLTSHMDSYDWTFSTYMRCLRCLLGYLWAHYPHPRSVAVLNGSSGYRRGQREGDTSSNLNFKSFGATVLHVWPSQHEPWNILIWPKHGEEAWK